MTRPPWPGPGRRWAVNLGGGGGVPLPLVTGTLHGIRHTDSCTLTSRESERGGGGEGTMEGRLIMERHKARKQRKRG